MKIKHIRKDNDVNAAIEAMMTSMYYQDDSEIGCFWYDSEREELFGVSSVQATSMKFYNSTQFNALVRTGPKLHEAIWKKEYFKGKDKRFQGDYTQVPRGRIFEFSDRGFVVMVGHWIDDYPEAKPLILDEFDLPTNTEFRIDEHWDIGHGWSQEF